MNYAARALNAAEAINLAQEADLAIGPLAVRPSLREVEVNGQTEAVEPRVLQALIVLSRTAGKVVSREQLIEKCWGGRIVGEDAINGCISKVRALAALTDPPAFTIETVPRVGYRLLRRSGADADAAVVAPPPAKRSLPRLSWRRLLWSGAALSLVGGGIALVFALTVPPPRWIIVESHQPFIASQSIERHPAFSPDGTMIAYAHGKDVHSRQIFLHLRSGGDPIQVTHDPFDAYAPAWSPDGTAIAYLEYSEKQPCRIMLVQVPSGPSHGIGHCRTAKRSSLSWSPGGRSLFYSDSPDASQPLRIMRFDLDSGAVTEITHPALGKVIADDSPAVSPDGKTLLLARDLGNLSHQIVLRSIADGTERVLLSHDDDDNSAAWSADSSTVFVARTKRADSSLWAYPVSGAEPLRITTSALPIGRLSTGPNGLLAMELEQGDSDDAVAPRTAGLAPRALDTNGLFGCNFDYAADGTFALIAHNGESQTIVVGLPGHLREVRRLKTNFVCGIVWSPDGSRLAYGEGDSSGFAISIMGRDGEPLARIPDPTRDFGSFAWTPDGKSLLMSRLDPKGWRVWRVSLDPPYMSQPLLPYGWDWVRMRGQTILGMRHGSAGIWRIDGTPKRLTNWPSEEFPWMWTVAGDKIVYGDFSNPGHPVFMAQPIDGGASAVQGYADGLSVWSGVAVDPRNGQVSYARWLHNITDIGWIRLARQ